MLTQLHLENFATFSDFRWPNHGRVNVIVGENDTGKSHLLKVLYVVAKCVEDLVVRTTIEPSYEPPIWKGILAEKLRWTFQPPNGLGDLIRNGAEKLRVEVELAETTCVFSIGATAKGGTLRTTAPALPSREIAAVFVPPKEVLTILSAIGITRERFEIYGFDDTYYDLVKLLRVPTTQGKVDEQLAAILRRLERLFKGRIKKSPDGFFFVRGDRSYSMPQTADGIKKIGLLARLIRSRSLKPGTILFLDEPETNLHPRAISIFTEMLFQLGRAGVQVYLATHSYFVIKQLEILAKKHKTSIPFCSLLRHGEEVEARFSDLRDGMPDNPIIDESIRLYEQAFEVDMQRPGK